MYQSARLIVRSRCGGARVELVIRRHDTHARDTRRRAVGRERPHTNTAPSRLKSNEHLARSQVLFSFAPPPPQPPLQVPPISNLFFRGFFWFGFSQADSLVVLVRSVRLGSLGIGTQFPDWTHGDESVTAPSVDFFRVFRPFLYELMRFSHRQKCTRFCRRSRNR